MVLPLPVFPTKYAWLNRVVAVGVGAGRAVTTTYVPVLLDRIEDAARAIVDTQLARACKIVEERRHEMQRLVDQLLEFDTLDASQIRACFPNDAPKKSLAA